MDCSLPGSSVHGIFQATVLEWGAIAFSRSKLVLLYFPMKHIRGLFLSLDHQEIGSYNFSITLIQIYVCVIMHINSISVLDFVKELFELGGEEKSIPSFPLPFICLSFHP